MSWPKRLVEYSFITLLVLVPLVLIPSASELFEFPKMLITYLLTAAIVCAWVCRILVEKRLIFRRTLLDIPILIFLLSQFSSLIFSIDPRTSWLGYYSRFNGGFVSLLSYALLYWGFVSNMDRKSSLKALHFAIGISVLVAIYGFLEHFGIDDELWVQDVAHRVFSTLGQPNWLAAYIVALIWLPISWAITEKKSSRLILFYSSTLLLYIVLLFTKSRSGLLAFGISSLVFWSILIIKNFRLENSLKIKNFKLQITSFIFLSLALTLIISNPVRDMVFSRFKVNPAPTVQTPASGTSLETGGTESGSIRKIVWTGALRIWRSSAKTFWLGTGPETFTMGYYTYRPIEHNYTSEWELLYNKAHNEFLNYLATTGILGLGSYLILLGSMLWVLIKNLKYPALLAGWLSIPVTNFWGFSVVIVQILMFLLPAIAIILASADPPPPPKLSTPSSSRIFAILTVIFVFFFLAFYIFKYFVADLKYSSGQKNLRAFTMTQEPQYLLNSLEDLKSAFSLNRKDPPIASDYSNVAAYVSILMHDSNPQGSQQLAKSSVLASDLAIKTSPRHPNYYKSRSRTMIILSTYDDKLLAEADSALAGAADISPTDPRIPFNRGTIAVFRQDIPTAIAYFEAALKLKPDYHDPKVRLAEIATMSATPE